MKNQEIADIFSQIADLLEILEEDRFRINSYRKSARTLEELTEAVEDVSADGRLTEIPGVGKSTAEKIQQYLATGRVATYDQLKKKVPPKLPELLEVSGLGPKTVAKLWRDGGVKSTAELKKALKKTPEKLAKIEGLGAKKLHQIEESLSFAASAGGRIRLDTAGRLADELLTAVGKARGARRAAAAGSLRRGRETIGDIDLLCEAAPAVAPKIIERFTQADNVQRVLAAGKTKGSVVLEGGVQADLRVVDRSSYGAAMAYFTGSKAHNVRMRELAIAKGLKLNEYGLFKGSRRVAGAEEADIYRSLGLQYVPPALREDRGELQAARDNALPTLLELKDIRGDLHMHTVASDGHNTIEEMIQACRSLGHKYMCFCDHSKSQIQANGLDEKRLAQHVKAIRAAAKKFKDIVVLAGVEVDIFKDGSLDFPDDVLARLDFVTASPHSALKLKHPESTKRLIRAIENPHVDCIGHATGRMLHSRPGMEIDIQEVAQAAAANNVALEINAHPVRLDLRDVHVKAAIDTGAKLIINTDAHRISDLELMTYGVMTARRGWATKADVINAFTPAKFKKWLDARR